VVSFPHVSPPKPCMYLFPPPYVLHVPPILSISSLEWYLVRTADHKAPDYVVSCTPVLTSLLLGPNILLSTLFWNTFSLRSSFNVSDQVSHTYKQGKVTVLYILMCVFLDNKLGDKVFWTEWQKSFRHLNLLLISYLIRFLFVKFVPKYLNSSSWDFVLHSDFETWPCT
jgi:hypothetical protein